MSAKDIKGQSHGSNTTEKQPAQQKLVPPAQITKSPPAPSKTNGNDTSPELDEEGDSDASGKEDEVSAAEESNNSDSGEDGESSDDQSESSDDSDDSDDGDDGESEAQPATSETISHQAKADMSEKASPKEEFEKEEEEEEEEEEEDDDDDEEEEDDDEEEEEEEEEDDDDDDEEEEEEEDSGENKADSLVVKTPAPEIQESAPDTSSSSSSSSGEEEEDKQDSHDQSTEKPISSEKEEGEEVDGENAKNGDNPAEPPAGKALKVPEDPEEDGFSSSDDSVEDIPGVLPPDIEAEFPPEESEEEAEEEEEETRDAMQVDAYAIPQTGDGEDAYAVPDSPIREKHPVPSKQPVAVKKRSHKRVPKKSILESDTPGDTPDETPKDTVQAETLALPTEKAQTITSPTRVQTPKKVPATLTTDITEATGATQTSQAPQTPQLAQIATPSRTQSTGRRRQSAPGSNSVFSDEEIAHIEEAAAMFRDERDITQQAFNEMVQDSATKHKELWTSLIDACGLKPRKSVLLRCRRMFHNFKEMYRWTAEEDEELAELVAEHGHKWVVISGILNRHREDVRKRWEERVVCRDDGRLFSWTFEEEKRLAKVVGEMAQIIEESRGKTAERRAANTGGIDPQTVTDISWAQVSERMGHTRTARQCRVKWADIEETYHFNDAGEFVGPPEPKELTRWQKRAMTMASRDWKTRGSRPKSAGGGRSFVRDVGEDGEQVPETSRHISDKVRRQLRQMSSTEKYRLVASIRESDVIHEEKIPWTRLVDETFRNQWRRPTRELVWSRLKRTVPDFHNKTVRQISQHLVDEYELHRQLGDGWELDYGGEESMESETEERPQKKRKHSKTEKATEKGRKGRKGQSEKPPKAYKSSDMAVDEDEGEEEEEERMPKDAEFEAALSGHRHRKRGKGDVPESDNEATDRRRSRRVDKTPSQRVVMEEDEEEEEEVQGTQGSKRGRRNSVDLGVDAKTTGPDPGPKRKMGLINGVGAKKRRIR